MRVLLALLLGGLLWSGCGGGEEPAKRAAGPECPKPPEATLRTLAEMRRAARAVEGPAEVRRLAGAVADVHADDWLDREDLLAQLEEQRECRAEAAALAERLRVPHYRRAVSRLKRTHSLRVQLMHDWEYVVSRRLTFAVDDYRLGLDDASATLQGVVAPTHVKAEHRRYLRAIRGLNRRVSRLERLENRLGEAQRVHATLPALARAANRAHERLMSATVAR